MAHEVSKEAAKARALELQRRLLPADTAAVLCYAGTPKDLYLDIRSYLVKASDRRFLRESQHEIRRLLLIDDEPKKRKEWPDDLTWSMSIGAVRNFRRDRNHPHLTRQDDAWFDFQLLCRSKDRATEILAYDWEIRFDDKSPVSFVRLDLNPPAHDNEADGLRSHLHLSSDDDGHSVPAPIMTPFEVLDLLLFGLYRTGRERGKKLLEGP